MAGTDAGARAVILHATETGQGPPVAVLHGLFGAGANLGAVARRLAERRRVITLDLRNHGASPHDPEMTYPAMAGDVLDTLAALGVERAALVGHSMGGKAAMTAALLRPGAVERLVVADIAPVRYPPAFRPYVEAMRAIPLLPGLTRARADAALAEAVPDKGVRAFLLQNLRFGERPSWRIGLEHIAAALPGIEGWDTPPGAAYPGPALFLSGARSDYVRPEHRPAIRALFPHARFAALRDAGHWLHADQPEAFAATVAAFLDG